MNEWKSYAGRLRWAMRHARKTNQSELARAIGVKPQSIQYLCAPDSGAQGSTHTAALAKELRVSAEWLASGEGQPAPLEQGRVRADESSLATYSAQPVQKALVTAAYKPSSIGDVEAIQNLDTVADGHVLTPILVTEVHAVKIKGNALSPYVKDGQYLLLQAAPDDLPAEENIVITLADGKMLIRELMHQRDGSLVVLPVHGGQPEAIEMADIQRIEAVACVVPRRWWRAN